MSKLTDDMRALASRLLDEADRIGRRAHEPNPLATDVLKDLAPAARLNASQAMNGRWYAYLVLPPGLTPVGSGHWIHNSSQGHYWLDTAADTEDEALRLALHRLVDTKVVVET